jgi:hypothetical protein
MPTAHASLEEPAAMPKRLLAVVPGLGEAVTVQPDPSQCSINAVEPPLLSIA